MNHLVLLAGGSGRRAGGEPKQLRMLAGQPLLLHSACSYANWPRAGRLIVVGRKELLSQTRDCLHPLNTTASPPAHGAKSAPAPILVPGGETRHASQVCGLEAARAGAEAHDIVFIHDAARPIVEHEELDRILAHFAADPACHIVSLASPTPDTVVQSESIPGRVSAVLSRTTLFLVKTPQAVRVSALEELMSVTETAGMTDLLSWGLAAHLTCAIVAAGFNNIKVTTESDFQLAHALLTNRPS